MVHGWLSDVEEAVVQLLAEGLTYREIEQKRHYAAGVAKMYATRARTRSGAKTNCQLTAMWAAKQSRVVLHGGPGYFGNTEAFHDADL